ncbi:adenosylcobinamide-GDP ribazoletransferase [Nocardioides zeae]|uniref:Adenosylcobinamide-GDP ribazoletransferase n=1 Tax=Nocardioides zeae TaxID=1457234 RepID=A0ACC6IFK0_9ACTN|nr:adenosylcobinamide-GDP ribazoletransferase [Nocardioides zeae]MDR6209492.1 adenosylcobinamide-GDP ribazoletransferase [Nocardioides zeae]
MRRRPGGDAVTGAGSPFGDGVRLAVGTLSVLRVPPPRRVDRDVAGVAMAVAPGVGLVLALLLAVPAGVLAHLGSAPLLLATVAVAGAAGLTRALHLDGLADVADGLGSGRSGEPALAIMKKSDIGPFGVATLVLALLAQVAAAGTLLGRDPVLGAVAVGLALVAGRVTLPWLCTPSWPAARGDGLGATVAGAVSRSRAAVAVALALGALAVATGVGTAVAAPSDPARWLLALGLGVVAGQGAAYLLARRCRRRFGGVTGDVYGACVESAVTVTLVVSALALG